MRNNRAVARCVRHRNRRQCLGERPDLVELDQDRVGDALVNPFLENRRIGDKQVVAHQLHALAELVGQQFPAGPIVFGHAILDGDDRIVVDPARKVVDELGGIEALALRSEFVLTILVELGTGGIEPEKDVPPRLVSCRLDGLQDGFERRLVRGQVGRETPFISDGGGQAAALEHALERVEHFRPPAQGLGERGRAYRQDHELLHVHAVVGMRAAVDDVHHRHRHADRRGAGEASV